MTVRHLKQPLEGAVCQHQERWRVVQEFQDLRAIIIPHRGEGAGGVSLPWTWWREAEGGSSAVPSHDASQGVRNTSSNTHEESEQSTWKTTHTSAKHRLIYENRDFAFVCNNRTKNERHIPSGSRGVPLPCCCCGGSCCCTSYSLAPTCFAGQCPNPSSQGTRRCLWTMPTDGFGSGQGPTKREARTNYYLLKSPHKLLVTSLSRSLQVQS